VGNHSLEWIKNEQFSPALDLILNGVRTYGIAYFNWQSQNIQYAYDPVGTKSHSGSDSIRQKRPNWIQSVSRSSPCSSLVCTLHTLQQRCVECGIGVWFFHSYSTPVF